MKHPLLDHPWYVGALNVLGNSGYQLVGIQSGPAVDPSEGPIIQFEILATVDDVVNLNVSLAQYLVEEGFIPLPAGEIKLTIFFTPN